MQQNCAQHVSGYNNPPTTFPAQPQGDTANFMLVDAQWNITESSFLEPLGQPKSQERAFVVRGKVRSGFMDSRGDPLCFLQTGPRLSASF